MKTLRRFGLFTLLVLLTPALAAAQSASPWSGVYVGAHVGGAWTDLHYTEIDDPDADLSPDVGGFAGGVLVGYGRPLNQFIVGAEFDTGAAGGSFAANDPDGNEYSAFDVGFNTHLRGRVAYPRGRYTPFFAAGLAALRIKVDDEDPGFGEGKASHLGLSIGAGVDAVVTDKISARAEFLHDNYNRKEHSISAPEGPFFPSYDVTVEGKSNILRFAVIYRF